MIVLLSLYCFGSIYPVEVSTGRFSCFSPILITVWYTLLYLACIVPGIALVQGTFGLHYNSGELSIPWFATSCLTWCVCHCHQWHVPDNLSCLRISQVLTLINKTVTLWVTGVLLLCALYALCVSVLKSLLNAWSPTSELLSPRWSNWLEGCWLQLICYALPKCLCP